MDILVTGGTGFLGSHVCKHFIELGYHVKIMGRDFKSVQDLLDSGAKPLRVDLRDETAVVAACKGCEAVVHAGALSSPWGQWQDFETINIGGTESILKGCELHGVRRLIHISSPAVIFDGRDQVDAQDHAPYAQRHLSHYSFSKQKAEELVLSRQPKLEAIILRPKAIYGPGDKALLPRLVGLARTGRLPRIGNGQNRVALTYVSDVVKAVECALKAPLIPFRRGGDVYPPPRPSRTSRNQGLPIASLPQRMGITSDFPVYTITGPENPVLWDVIRTLLESLNIQANFRPIPEWIAAKVANVLEVWGEISKREPKLTRYTVALLARHQTYDISRARHDLGYEPKVFVAQGLSETIKELDL